MIKPVIKINKFCVVLLGICVLLLLPAVARAATLYFSPSSGSYAIGNNIPVGIFVSSADQAMNAASGIVSFPPDKLEVTSLSKDGSIIALWVRETTFSNTLGTINFEGIVLNPGFTGASGKIITANFKVKAAGIAPISFSSGSVLANDGKGTNILASLGSASFSLGEQITPEVETPSVVVGAPAAPKISSPTHPNSEKWYSNNDPKFTWKVPEDVTRVRLLVGHNPVVVPTVSYSEPISEKQLEDLADEVWYFHCQLQNKFGWGGVSHFKFQIDTTPPLPFEIEVKEGKETTNPQPTLVFEATDEMSGIDYYEVKIDQEPSIKIKEKEYKTPVQTFGIHTIIVKAVDKAGNETLAMTEINILAIETPVITDYPKTLLPGANLLIKGTAAIENKIELYIQKENEESKVDETESDKQGKWSYIGTESLREGIYKVWAQSVNFLGARSKPSEKVTIQVSPPAFIKIGKLAIDYLTTIILLLVLILAIVLGIIWAWQKIIKRKKRLRKEITEAEKALYIAFKTLKEETKEQIAKLDGQSDLNEREKEISDELKRALKTSEKFIGKEIKDIEKEIH